jgi:hypothetical protein
MVSVFFIGKRFLPELNEKNRDKEGEGFSLRARNDSNAVRGKDLMQGARNFGDNNPKYEISFCHFDRREKSFSIEGTRS